MMSLNLTISEDFSEEELIFENQKKFQEYLVGYNNVKDNLEEFSKSIVQFIEEIGELLQADKRWRSFRKSDCDSKEKLDEIADVAIVLMNIILFSGFTYSDVINAIQTKQEINFERLFG